MNRFFAATLALLVFIVFDTTPVAATPVPRLTPTPTRTPTPTPTSLTPGTATPTPATAVGNWFGYATVACDFDGNGKDDVAASAPYEDLLGQENAGQVNVVYSQAAGGLNMTQPIAGQTWAQGLNGIEDTAEAGDQFGFALAAGDFNNDHFCDLVVGVRGEIYVGTNRGGAVQILYGSASGLQAVAPQDQFWTLDIVVRSNASKDGDGFGQSLAVADFNGDSYEDLAIGVPDRSVERAGTTATHAGIVVILHGSASGLQASSPAFQIFNENSPHVASTAARLSRFGSTLATGDFNADGYADLAVGAPTEKVNGSAAFLEDGEEAGFVHVLYGSTSGLAGADQGLCQETGGMGDMLEDTDWFGGALAVGDFDADGVSDLAIGVPGERIVTLPVSSGAEGMVQVLYGRRGTGLSTDRVQTFSQQTSGIAGDSRPLEYFGNVLAAGNFDNKGGDDLAIGAPGQSVGGALHVLYGKTGTGLSADGSQYFTQATLQEISEGGDFFPWALAVGHVYGAHADLVAGVPRESFPAPGLRNAGLFHVVRGGSTGLTTSGSMLYYRWWW